MAHPELTGWDYLTLALAFAVIAVYAYLRLKRMLGKSVSSGGGCCGCSSQGSCSSSRATDPSAAVLVDLPKKYHTNP